MTDFEIFAGEDFALALTAYESVLDPDTGEMVSVEVDLTDYDLVAKLQTTSLGSTVTSSTVTDSEQVNIQRVGLGGFEMNIPNTQSRRLTAGFMTLTILLKHKQSDVRSIGMSKLVEVKKSNLSNYGA